LGRKFSEAARYNPNYEHLFSRSYAVAQAGVLAAFGQHALARLFGAADTLTESMGFAASARLRADQESTAAVVCRKGPAQPRVFVREHREPESDYAGARQRQHRDPKFVVALRKWGVEGPAQGVGYLVAHRQRAARAALLFTVMRYEPSTEM
jgi:hypothetical protein